MERGKKYLILGMISLISLFLFSGIVWAQTNRSIHLSWMDHDASDSTMVVTWLENFGNNSKLQSYVKYGTKSGVYSERVAAMSKLSVPLKNDFHHPNSDTPLDTYVHSVELSDLTPDTTYYYVVGVKNDWSDENSFATGPPVKGQENFRFIVGSDSHSGNPKSRRNQLAYHILKDTSKPRPGFLFFGGDEITGNNGHVIPTTNIKWAKQWHKFFSPTASSGNYKGAWAKLLANFPYMTADSNHVDSDDSFFELFNYPYPFGTMRLADKPESESACSYVTNYHKSKRGNNGWYSFNYGNAHFIVLQINTAKWSNDPRFCTWNAPPYGDQYQWLEEDLEEANEDPDIRWKFAIWHSAPYSFVPNAKMAEITAETDADRGLTRNKYLQNTICPLLTEYGVDMVFSGHQHRYERSKMIYNDDSTRSLNKNGHGKTIEQDDYKIYDGSKKGVVYVVTGGMGNVTSKKSPNKNKYTAEKPDGSKVYMRASHYLVVDIDNNNDTLTCNAVGYEVLPKKKIDFSQPPTSLDEFKIIKTNNFNE